MTLHPTREVRSFISPSTGKRTYKRFPVPVPPRREGLPVEWTIPPFLTGPGVDNDTHEVDSDTVVTCNPGSYTGTETVTLSYQWQLNGQAVLGATASTTTRTVAENGQALTCVVTGTNEFIRSAVSNSLTVVDPAVAAFPAAITASHIMIDEIRDPADAGAGGGDVAAGTIGGRIRLKAHASLATAAGYTLKWNSSTVSGGIPAASQKTIVPGNTYGISFSNGVGAVVYQNLFWERDADGQTFPAFPNSGVTTAADWDGSVTPAKAARTITAHPTEATRGEVSFTTLGLDTGGVEETVWSTLSSTVRDSAIAQSMGRYYNVSTSGTGSGAGSVGIVTVLHSSIIGVPYASFAGDTAADARTLEIVSNFNQSANMPFCAATPSAARELFFPAMWTLVDRTTRLSASVTAERARAVLIAKAQLLAYAAQMSDNNGGSYRTISGYDAPEGVYGVNANFSTGPIMTVLCAAAFLGLTEAANFLETVDVSAFRAEVIATLGASSNMGTTWNWINTSQTVGNFYRHGPHANALTNSQLTTRIRGWRFRGFPLTNVARIFMPSLLANDGPGFNRAIPPNKFSNGSNPSCGYALPRPMSLRGYFAPTSQNIVIPVSGGLEYGLPSANRAGMIHSHDTDCEWCENSATDEGTRASMGYASQTRAMIDVTILALTAAGLFDAEDVLLKPALHRWWKAQNVYQYRDTYGGYYLAHMAATTPPTGMNGGAGFGDDTTDWLVTRVSTGGLNMRQEVGHAIASAIHHKNRVQVAKNYDFAGNVTRWKSTGSATVAYDSGDGSALVTVSGAGGGIQNQDADWTSGDDTTGHMWLKGGITYEVAPIIKRGTYPAQAVVIDCNGNLATTAALTASYATYSREYTPSVDERLVLKVKGSASFTGTMNISEISVRPL